MADFIKSFKLTSCIEGGYAFDKDDSGGETYKGISRNNEPRWDGWTIVDSLKKESGFPNNLSANNILQLQVKSLYKTNYWNALNLEEIQDQKVANELYDTAVNMGVGRSALFFQRSLNCVNRNGSLFPDLKLDGKIGSKTINCFNALSAADRFIVWKLFNCLQGEKYISICEANPTQKKFIRSWANRVFEL